MGFESLHLHPQDKRTPQRVLLSLSRMPGTILAPVRGRCDPRRPRCSTGARRIPWSLRIRRRFAGTCRYASRRLVRGRIPPDVTSINRLPVTVRGGGCSSRTPRTVIARVYQRRWRDYDRFMRMFAAKATQTRASRVTTAEMPLRLRPLLASSRPDERAVADGGAFSRGAATSAAASATLMSGIQAKLEISQPDDPSELEADRVADQVLDTTEGRPSITSRLAEVQRLCAECEEEQTEGRNRSTGARVEASLTGGAPLPDETRGFFESRFGFDFSRVRVHADERATAAAGAVQAHAFTKGRDIVFGAGRYSPSTPTGQRLLAHELTHVIQQGAGGSRATEDTARLSKGRPSISRLLDEGRGTGDEEDIDGRIQRLAITRNFFSSGTCGQRRVRWIFSLTAPAPEDGYIVQQVGRFEIGGSCPAVSGPPGPLAPFWEAWFVQKGKTNEHLHAAMGFTDESARPSAPSSAGTQISAGTIKFFKKSITGDLGTDGIPPAGGANPGWGPGNAPPSGALPSTLTMPSWWGNSHEGPMTREARSVWDCCDADPAKHTNSVTATP